MQSDQEDILEEFIQRSFGAPFLYVPKKYLKGQAHREPADLAWVNDDFVVLFYMMSSGSDVVSQTEHNLKQAKGYKRLWGTGVTKYALRGKNRFGDECFVPFNKVRTLLTFLVVSGQCGIRLQAPEATDVHCATMTVPDQLIHWISSFGGTIVDLLQIIFSFLQEESNLPNEEPERFQLLAELARTYVRQSIARADPEGLILHGNSSLDYKFMYEHLAKMRLPASIGHAVSSPESRKQVARVFADLTLVEYASLTATAERAIQASEPPQFQKWVVLKIRGLYYSFVVWTVNMSAKNVIEPTTAAIDASKNADGIVDSISVQYGNVMGVNDFRVPLMFGLPTNLPRPHAIVLAEKIISYASPQ